MNIKENIKIAVFSIRTNMMRSLLTMLGIIIGVASVIAIITVGTGGRDYIIGMIEDMGASVVSISVKTNAATSSDYINYNDIEAIRNLESVEYVTPVTISMGSIDAEGNTGMGAAIGCDADVASLLKTPCKYGRYFTQEEYDAQRAVAIIDTMSAKQLFGEENCVGKYLTYTVSGRSVKFKIIGVTDVAGSFGMDTEQLSSMSMVGNMGISGGMIMAPGNVVSSLMGRNDKYEMLYISATDENQLDAVGNTASNVLMARHNNQDRDVYAVTNMATYIDLLNTVINVFTTFIAAVSAISLLVGGIGVMNIMLVSVTERTREIGIRKALGAKTSTISLQFLTESVIICLIGGIIGIIIGIVGAKLVSYIMAIPLQISIMSIVIAIGFSSAIGIFFGMYPARKAAKMAPIEALRRD